LAVGRDAAARNAGNDRVDSQSQVVCSQDAGCGLLRLPSAPSA
jgi:hypothetical protein